MRQDILQHKLILIEGKLYRKPETEPIREQRSRVPYSTTTDRELEYQQIYLRERANARTEW
jgi:hypothetical protein